MRPLPAADRLTHALVGACIAAGVALLLGLLHVPPLPAAGGAALAVVLAALGREAYNHRRGGEWSWPDIHWTVAGLVPSLAAMLAGVIGRC